MEYLKHFGSAGEYYPAFFEMKLKIDEMIDLNTCSDMDFALFFHEYIHFLQDVTTSYGLTRCYSYGEYIQSVVNDIRNKPKGVIKVPYLYDDNRDNIMLGNYLSDITQGDSSDGSFVDYLSNVKIDWDNIDGLPYEHEYLKSLKIPLLTADGDIMLAIGSYCLKESIAYIMQRTLTVDKDHLPDYPYNAAEIIAKAVYPEFAENTLNVLALADCCLMYSNPGEIYYRMLLQMKDKHYLPAKPHDIYFHLKEAKIGIGDKISDPFTQFSALTEEVRKKLKSYFVNPEYPEMHEPYHKWVDTVLDYVKKLRIRRPAFLLDMIYEGNARQSATLAEIINTIGTPLMRNKRQDYFTIKPDGQRGYSVEINKSVKQIYKILHEGVFSCELFPWCKNSGIPTDEKKCLHRPWEMCACKELCPTSMLWKNWGLMGFEPLRNKY